MTLLQWALELATVDYKLRLQDRMLAYCKR